MAANKVLLPTKYSGKNEGHAQSCRVSANWQSNKELPDWQAMWPFLPINQGTLFHLCIIAHTLNEPGVRVFCFVCFAYKNKIQYLFLSNLDGIFEIINNTKCIHSWKFKNICKNIFIWMVYFFQFILPVFQDSLLQ